MVSRFPLGQLVLAGSFLFSPAPGSAQQPLTLQQAQRIAVERSGLVAAQDAAEQSARELAVAARQLPDPVLKFGVDNLPVDGPDRFSLSRDFMTMRRIGVMQEIPRPDKRRLRAERVERDIERIAAERAAAVATVQKETALAWIDRHYSQATVDLLARQLEEARLQEHGAEIAYRSGRGSQADVFALRAAAAILGDRVLQAARQLQGSRLMLARWVGPEAERQPAAGGVDWQASPAADAIPMPAARLPRLRQLAAESAAAQTDLQQAVANTRADWTVEASYAQRGPGYSNMLSVGVAIPLKLDRAARQDREVAARRAALAAAQARYQDALAAQEAELRVLLNDWQSNTQRVARLAAQLLPAARLRTDAALTAYRAGTGDLAGVLSARRDEIDARMQVLALEAETARLWAQLTYVVPDAGGSPTAKERP